jgi:hypothetical protein
VQAATKRVRTTPSPTRVKVDNYICGMKKRWTTLLQIAFIALKLMNYITWSWVWVLSPLWISISMLLVFIATTALINQKPQGRS